MKRFAQFGGEYATFCKIRDRVTFSGQLQVFSAVRLQVFRAV
jgi:hypothetical protein